MKVRNTFILLAIVALLVGGIVFAVASLPQRKQSPQNSARVKLEYSNRELISQNYTPPDVAPIPMSSDRLLVPVGDTLYMLDSNNREPLKRSVRRLVCSRR